MRTILQNIARVLLVGSNVVVLAGCGFLPGFGLLESPTLYYLPVSDVATRVACEMDEFILEHRGARPVYGPHEKWVLADQDITVTLTLTTDDSGYVNFTGINVAKVGLGALARFISTQSSIPSLAAKASVKTTKSAAIKFTVSPKDLRTDKEELAKCQKWIQSENILTRSERLAEQLL